MSIYLPIAEMSVNVWVLLAFGGAIGFLSGLFGIGGGFLLTPLLIFLGVPPAVAAATGANTVIAPSVSGILSALRRRTIDLKMGAILVVGGLAGSAASVWIFSLLRRLGQIDLAVSLGYVLLLGTIGGLMFLESVRAMRRRKAAGGTPRGRLHRHTWIHGLPLKMRFPSSRLYISALVPAGIGFGVGVLSGLMGVGGGFIMVPAMIYVVGMPTSLVVGTSQLQIIVVSASVTILQSYANHSVDVLLAAVLIAGSLVAAPYGVRFGARLRAEQLRILLALLVLAVAGQLAYRLVSVPGDLFSFEPAAAPVAAVTSE